MASQFLRNTEWQNIFGLNVVHEEQEARSRAIHRVKESKR